MSDDEKAEQYRLWLVHHTKSLADITELLVKDVERVNETRMDADTMIRCREVIAASQAALLGLRQDLETVIGHTIGPDFIDVDGKRYHRENRWGTSGAQNADLVRAVLDSRLVDPQTGEVVEESPVDRIKHVYPLAVRDARKTALKARGLDQSEFIAREWRGFNIVEDR